MLREFHESRTFTRSVNTTFLVLIPKKGGAKDLNDFRPISMVGSLYKLLAKVLANKLKKVVGKVILAYQNVFIEEREITNTSLIENELIDHWRKKGGEGCGLQVRYRESL